jgi:hypothetical protein
MYKRASYLTKNEKDQRSTSLDYAIILTVIVNIDELLNIFRLAVTSLSNFFM